MMKWLLISMASVTVWGSLAQAKEAKPAATAPAHAAAASGAPGTPTPLPLAVRRRTEAAAVLERTPTEQTQVFGTIPESLAGLWLTITSYKAGDQVQNGYQFYRIERKDSKWTMQQLKGPGTDALYNGVNQATAKNQPCELDAETVDSVKPMVSKLERVSAPNRVNKVILRTAENFLPNPPPEAAGAKFSIDLFQSTARGVIMGANTFYVKELTPDRMAGSLTTGVLPTTSGTVVPVGFSGTFVMYRLQ